MRCTSCPNYRPRVPYDGPTPCRVLFLGEAPSRKEDERGIPFCGPTGDELNYTYLPIAGLPRSSVGVYNAFCCSHKDYHNPKDTEAIACSNVHLGPLLAELKPEVIVPMGSIACSVFPNINLNLHHGLPIPAKYGPWQGTLFPTYHPSAGMKPGGSGYMIAISRDFYELGRYLNGQSTAPVNYYPNPDYKVARTEDDIDAYLDPGEIPYISGDTESLPDGSPYCVTITTRPGTGLLIYVRDKHLIEHLAGIICNFGFADPTEYHHWLFHNYLHDEIPFVQLSIPIGPFTDTMVYAYELCLGGGGDEEEESRAGRGSLGLKVLAYRHLGMTMRTFKETVYPHSVPYLQKWLWAAEELTRPFDKKAKICDCGCPQENHSPKGATQRCIGPCTNCTCPKYKKRPSPPDSPDFKRLNSLYTRITNIITDLIKKPYPETDPWKRIHQWDDDSDLPYLESFLGPIPQASIAHVPEPELLTYACSDSDATLRLFHFLEHYSLDPWIFFKD